jgi:hypothetical protein
MKISLKSLISIFEWRPLPSLSTRDENGRDIFRPYSRPNSFRGVLIRPYPSPDI